MILIVARGTIRKMDKNILCYLIENASQHVITLIDIV